MNATQKIRFKKLVDAFHAAESKRSELEKAWADYQDLYTGAGVGGERQTRESARKVNVTFQTVEIMVSAAIERFPKIYARPRKKEAIVSARLAEKALSHWESMNRTELQVENAHRDAAIFGDGFLKTAWVKELSRQVEPDPDELQSMLTKRDLLAEKTGAFVSDKDVYDYLKEMSVQVVSNKPITRRISPFDLWFDMQATDMADVAFFAHRYRRPLESVKNDLGFRRKQRRNLDVSAQLNSDHGRGTSYAEVSPFYGGLDMVDLVELWDLHEEKLYVVEYGKLDSGQDDALYDGSFPYAIGHPLTHIPFFDVPDQLYSMGIVELIAPLQQELNELVEDTAMQRVRSKRKWATAKGLLDVDAREALQSDEEDQVVEVDMDVLNKLGLRLSEVLVAINGPEVSGTNVSLAENMLSFIYGITGLTEYQRGLVSSYRSASEVNTVTDYATSRLSRMIRNVQFGRVDVARKEIGMAAQFMETQEVLRIVGNDPDLAKLKGKFEDGRGNILFPFNRADIAGEYEMELESGSYDPESKAQRLDRWSQVFALLSQFPELDRKQVIKELMVELGVPDPERFLAVGVQPPLLPMGSQPGASAPAAGGGRPAGSSRDSVLGGMAGGLAPLQ